MNHLNQLRCVCGEEIQEDIQILEEEEMCLDCYESAMEAAYKDIPDVFKDVLNEVKL